CARDDNGRDGDSERSDPTSIQHGCPPSDGLIRPIFGPVVLKLLFKFYWLLVVHLYHNKLHSPKRLPPRRCRTAANGPSRPTTLGRPRDAFGALRTWTDFHRATICSE